jgi:hypothetical protein
VGSTRRTTGMANPRQKSKASAEENLGQSVVSMCRPQAGDDVAPVRKRRGTTPLATPWRGRSMKAVTGLPVRLY